MQCHSDNWRRKLPTTFGTKLNALKPSTQWITILKLSKKNTSVCTARTMFERASNCFPQSVKSGMRTQASKPMAWYLSEIQSHQIIWTRGQIKRPMQFKVARVRVNHFFLQCQSHMVIAWRPNLYDLELFAAILHRGILATSLSRLKCQKFCSIQPSRQTLCSSRRKVNFLVRVRELQRSQKRNRNFHSRLSVRKFY